MKKGPMELKLNVKEKETHYGSKTKEYSYNVTR